MMIVLGSVTAVPRGQQALIRSSRMKESRLPGLLSLESCWDTAVTAVPRGQRALICKTHTILTGTEGKKEKSNTDHGDD